MVAGLRQSRLRLLRAGGFLILNSVWKGGKVVFSSELFNSDILVVLKKQLDAAMLTQRVIANNVANVDTPGFKKSSVRFIDQLRQALDSQNLSLKTSHPRHIQTSVTLTRVEPVVVKEGSTTIGHNQNNVDIEEEMINLVANNLAYQAATRALSDRLTLLEYVIKGR